MAAIEVTVGITDAFHGRKSSITSYAVDEAITPLDATQSSPGVGTISFGAVESEGSIFAMDKSIELRDGSRGQALGTVRAIGTADLALSVTADSVLSLLNATKWAQPYSGTLGGAITYYLSLVNVLGGFEIQPAIASKSVTLRGWRDNVLTMLSNLCVANQIEMSVVYDNIVFRAPRVNTAVVKRDSSRSWSADRGSPAKTIEGYWYETQTVTNKVLYPSPIEDPRQGFQVDVNEMLDPTRIQLSATPSSLNQPAAVDFLGPSYSDTQGAYVVLGNDDLPIPAAEWNAKGGQVRVSIDPDAPDYLVINIRGMNEPRDSEEGGRAPYRVGVMSSGDNTFYPALYVTGSGVAYIKNKLTISTGATNTEVDVGATVDNVTITSMAQLATAMQKGVLRYSGVNYTASGSASSLTKSGAGEEFATSKLSAFDDQFSGQKLSSLDGMGWTFAEFDAYYASLVTDRFENQLFGNASGARVLRDGSWCRINSATTTQDSTSYSATLDNLWADYDDAWSGKKLAAWDSAWAGHKLRDWDMRPLRGA